MVPWSEESICHHCGDRWTRQPGFFNKLADY
jgi:hypothetical protein